MDEPFCFKKTEGQDDFDYSGDAAARAGGAFLQAFWKRKSALDHAKATPEWTETVLDWFAEAAPQVDVVVDARRSKRGMRKMPSFPECLAEIAPRFERRIGTAECMVDLSHHRFLTYKDPQYEKGHDFWERAYAKEAKPEALLVLESEFGRQRNEKANSHRVLEDASKLVALAARVKVVVFGSNTRAEQQRIKGVAELMRYQDRTVTRDGDKPTWLWLDLPWCSWDELPPSGWVGQAGEGPAFRTIACRT